MKCECKEKGILKPGMASWYLEEELPYVNHEPNECKCMNDLKRYWKNGQKIWLCSNCVMGKMKIVEELKKEQEIGK